jgi:hypothetical protein
MSGGGLAVVKDVIVDIALTGQEGCAILAGARMLGNALARPILSAQPLSGYW